jgi:hypothetical protein
MSEHPRGDDVVNQVGEDRRQFVKKLIAAPYVLPVVTSFTLTALSAQPAMAGASNTTFS